MKRDPQSAGSSDQDHFKSLDNQEWKRSHFGGLTPAFINGLELSEIFFREQVEPLVREFFPSTKIAAGRLDYGSDVLGYDTELSRDHAWGPQVTLYLTDDDLVAVKDNIDSLLQAKLPLVCREYPTRMTRDWVWKPTPDGSGHHRVRIESTRSFFEKELGYVPSAEMSPADWLAFPAQKLRVLASGKIFVDDDGELSRSRENVIWYPRDIWLHVMACQWQKLSERAPFAGRCAHVGDMWGALSNAMETIDVLAHTIHLLDKRYPPYRKWLGTSLKELPIGSQLIEVSERIRLASSWSDMESRIIEAYQLVANYHNSLDDLPRINVEVINFHSRPYKMIDIESIVRNLKTAIGDSAVRDLSLAKGAVWQLTEYDTALCNVECLKAYRAMLQSGAF